MLESYLPILVMVVIAAAFAVGTIVASKLLGPRRRAKDTGLKLIPYECGVDPYVETSGRRQHIRFYLVAVLFILFDLEVVFVIPWAVTFRQAVEDGWGMFSLAAGMVFLVLLTVGLIYEWKKGALQWD